MLIFWLRVQYPFKGRKNISLGETYSEKKLIHMSPQQRGKIGPKKIVCLP